jgi:endonuclease/exonuclease/phosphatase (EEP) superfamily protein YafD
MSRRFVGWVFVGASLLLHLFTVYCFSRQPDRFAAFTVIPIWLWGGLGLLLSCSAFYFLRASLSLVVTAVWAVTLLIGADEARVLANFGKAAPQPGRAALYEGKPLLRVMTLNCAFFTQGDPAAEIAAWQPDVVLLQEVQPYQVRKIADGLYAGRGDYRAHQTNGIVTRWKIQREVFVPSPTQHNHQVTIVTPAGKSFEVVNVHLETAATDLRLWNPEVWQTHQKNRQIRRGELLLSQQLLEQTTQFPLTPTIFGGDFNAPAMDAVYRPLARDFSDAFNTAGTGWGNTFHRRFPILRIDHLHTTRHFTAVHCGAFTTRHSDHRLVVADFLTKFPEAP